MASGPLPGAVPSAEGAEHVEKKDQKKDQKKRRKEPKKQETPKTEKQETPKRSRTSRASAVSGFSTTTRGTAVSTAFSTATGATGAKKKTGGKPAQQQGQVQKRVSTVSHATQASSLFAPQASTPFKTRELWFAPAGQKFPTGTSGTSNFFSTTKPEGQGVTGVVVGLRSGDGNQSLLGDSRGQGNAQHVRNAAGRKPPVGRAVSPQRQPSQPQEPGQAIKGSQPLFLEQQESHPSPRATQESGGTQGQEADEIETKETQPKLSQQKHSAFSATSAAYKNSLGLPTVKMESGEPGDAVDASHADLCQVIIVKDVTILEFYLEDRFPRFVQWVRRNIVQLATHSVVHIVIWLTGVFGHLIFVLTNHGKEAGYSISSGGSFDGPYATVTVLTYLAHIECVLMVPFAVFVLGSLNHEIMVALLTKNTKFRYLLVCMLLWVSGFVWIFVQHGIRMGGSFFSTVMTTCIAVCGFYGSIAFDAFHLLLAAHKHMRVPVLIAIALVATGSTGLSLLMFLENTEFLPRTCLEIDKMQAFFPHGSEICANHLGCLSFGASIPFYLYSLYALIRMPTGYLLLFSRDYRIDFEEAKRRREMEEMEGMEGIDGIEMALEGEALEGESAGKEAETGELEGDLALGDSEGSSERNSPRKSANSVVVRFSSRELAEEKSISLESSSSQEQDQGEPAQKQDPPDQRITQRKETDEALALNQESKKKTVFYSSAIRQLVFRSLSTAVTVNKAVSGVPTADSAQLDDSFDSGVDPASEDPKFDEYQMVFVQDKTNLECLCSGTKWGGLASYFSRTVMGRWLVFFSGHAILWASLLLVHTIFMLLPAAKAAGYSIQKASFNGPYLWVTVVTILLHIWSFIIVFYALWCVVCLGNGETVQALFKGNLQFQFLMLCILIYVAGVIWMFSSHGIRIGGSSITAVLFTMKILFASYFLAAIDGFHFVIQQFLADKMVWRAVYVIWTIIVGFSSVQALLMFFQSTELFPRTCLTVPEVPALNFRSKDFCTSHIALLGLSTFVPFFCYGWYVILICQDGLGYLLLFSRRYRILGEFEEEAQRILELGHELGEVGELEGELDELEEEGQTFGDALIEEEEEEDEEDLDGKDGKDGGESRSESAGSSESAGQNLRKLKDLKQEDLT